MLTADEIIAEAESRVGIADTDHALQRNLEALVGSINTDARLPASGEAAVRDWLLNPTVDRLTGLKWLGTHPEIADEQVVAPVFLCGLPRSGTTYFQYLFDRDPRFRLLRTWEAAAPNPPPGLDPTAIAQRKAREAERQRSALGQVENFDALHLIDQDGPQECHSILEQAYAAAGFNNLFRVPGYFDFLLDEADLEAAYRIHRRQLQLLQWRLPQPRWALKYPNHVIAMEAILRVYPDARFVMTHRDPVQTLASIAKMSLKLRELRYDTPVDPHEVGRDMLHFVARHIERIMAFDQDPDGARAIHVDYYALVRDPVAEMRQIHAGLGLDTPDALADAVGAWHRANPKNARGKNEYTLEQWGLDDAAVAEQFSDYMRRFAIPREKDGLARIGA